MKQKLEPVYKRRGIYYRPESKIFTILFNQSKKERISLNQIVDRLIKGSEILG